MLNLKELQYLSKSLTVLYVEDSVPLLKQTSLYLSKLFLKVYTATDGKEGLKKYKQYLPDIVITDLTMPYIDGLELIKILKEMTPKLKIIVISAHSDTTTLLEVIHIGIFDFIPKPIDITLLSNALLRISMEFSKNNKIVDKNLLEKEIKLLNKFNLLSKSDNVVELINHYKGVPIIHEGIIIKVDESGVFIHTSNVQTLAILIEKSTTIESKYFDFMIDAKFDYIDNDIREIKLTELSKLNVSSKSREQLRMIVDDDFHVIVRIKDKKINNKIIDVSVKSISLFLEQNDLSKDEVLDLTLGFTTHHKGGDILFEDKNIISTKANIFKIISKNNGVEVVLLFELSKFNEDELNKYIFERELEVIKEFRTLKISDLKV